MKHYDHHHTTVAEARACEAQRQQGTVITKPEPQAAKPLYLTRLERAHAKATPVAKATQAQPAWMNSPAHPNRVKYANDLINKRETAGLPVNLLEVAMHLMEGKPVSAGEIAPLIDALRECPRKGNATPAPAAQAKAEATSEPTLRDLAEGLADKGYYALRTPGSVDEIHYYRITRSKKGYVKVQEQASDTLWPVDNYRRAQAVVKAIQEDVEAARNLYADTLERCYACGRTLTDELSRALRIGPDCRSK